VLMPSRTEGFGLVGLEAILAGTPVLVSEQSGLGELLREVLTREAAARHIVRVTGDVKVDAEAWSRAAEGILLDREAAFRRDGVACASGETVELAVCDQRASDGTRGVALRSPRHCHGRRSKEQLQPMTGLRVVLQRGLLAGIAPS